MQNLSTVEPNAATSAVAETPLLVTGEPSLFSAPVPAPASILPPAIAPAPTGPVLPAILVADDDPDDRFFIKRLIAKTGARNPVIAFDDGTEVVNYLGGIAVASAEVRQRAPRLLFLDLNMRGLGGFGFLEWVRQQKTALPLTIVVLSNSAEPADMARAMALGAHRYLVKYPSVHTFTTIVRSVFPYHLGPVAASA